VLLASIILSYSRIFVVILLILVLSLLGYLERIKLRAVLVGVLLVISFYGLMISAPQNDTTSFLGKLARIFDELKVTDYSNMQDINDNWRGYETYRALATFSSGETWQLFTGQGFGALADLGLYMKLAGEYYSYIPVLHNGYAYILLKTGILGLILYLIFYFNLIRFALLSGNFISRERVFFARLILGCVLCLMVTMYVVGGMAEMNDAELVLILGYSAARLRLFQTAG